MKVKVAPFKFDLESVSHERVQKKLIIHTYIRIRDVETGEDSRLKISHQLGKSKYRNNLVKAYRKALHWAIMHEIEENLIINGIRQDPHKRGLHG